MKVTSRILSVVLAAALYVGLNVSGAAVLGLADVSAAHAAMVSSIEVRGNKRVDAATIRNYLSIRPGKSFDNSDIDAATKRLFSTGLFSDVRINQVGGTLVIQVAEYPTVNQVIFVGNKKIKDEDLTRAVRLKPQGSFSNAILDGDIKRIKEAYDHIGRSDATVSPQVIDLGEDRVNVVFHVDEGGVVPLRAGLVLERAVYGDAELTDLRALGRGAQLGVTGKIPD